MTRLELAEKIKLAKAKKGVSWVDIAKKVGQSEVWTTAALLGQMAMSPKEGEGRRQDPRSVEGRGIPADPDSL